MKLLDQVGSVEIGCGFPGAVFWAVPFPVHQEVLKGQQFLQSVVHGWTGSGEEPGMASVVRCEWDPLGGGGRQTVNDEVHGDGVPGMGRCGQRLEQAGWLGWDVLGLPTYITGSDIPVNVCPDLGPPELTGQEMGRFLVAEVPGGQGLVGQTEDSGSEWSWGNVEVVLVEQQPSLVEQGLLRLCWRS
ncbi:UNVERIFIED_CONTAM: hypothetical protein K2H54_006377 [Gekko kuhli]